MIETFGPIWVLTMLGYVIRRTRALNDAAAEGLGRFVFQLAMPAAIYLTLARLPLSEFAGRPLIAFAISTVIVIGAGWLVAGRLFHREPGERAIWAMAAGYVNSANLGIPVAMLVLGNIWFLVNVILLQSLVITPLVLLALERATDAHQRIRLRRLIMMPLRNPVIFASVFGIITSATGLRAPALVTASLTVLAAAAVPVALVALGASLHRENSTDERAHGQLGVITVAKLAVQPLIGWLAGTFVLHLSRPEQLAVVICAGLPTAQITFIFANEYRVAQTLSSRAVLLTTTFSMATLAAIAYLSRCHLPG